MLLRLAAIGTAAWLAAAACVGAAEPARPIAFKKIPLDGKFRSEGACVADFNRDGKPDIAAGRVWYEAPHWKLHVVEPPLRDFDPKGYSGSFCNFASDLSGDGWPDLIVVDFPGTPTYWYENPRNADRPWTRRVVAQVSNNESPTYLDLDGDGQRELVLAVAPPGGADGQEKTMAILRPAADPASEWTAEKISANNAPGTSRYSHGLGVGDVNRDGRQDVLVPQGWWEAPAKRGDAPWTFHPAPLGEDCAQMYVFDCDGDGDNDVLSSSAHRVGIWWHEQLQGPNGQPAWRTHVIERSFSQTHSLCVADLSGDGLPDFVTGKRWWAHGPSGDVDPGAPAVLAWFELRREGGAPRWIRHDIDDDNGVGTQFEVADVNGDGLADIVTANKKGVRWFQQIRGER